MRAKLTIANIQQGTNCERLTFRAVCKSDGYSTDGLDENNTFATYTPQADLTMTITNPALLGKFAEGQTFYVDFTPAE